MEGWLTRMGMIRIAVLLSFASHLVLTLLAGIRRRKASGGRTLILWLVYQLANWAAAYALGNLSFGSRSEERPQLIAFWAPFLLQHLGGPDNISAYSLEDNVLSGRQALNVLVQVGGAIYVVYKHIYLGGSGDRALLWASIIILIVGIVKYVERVLALRRGNLGNIRSSSKKKQLSRLTHVRRGNDVLDNEQALMFAHNMFPFCQRAMTDSSVDMDSSDLEASREIFCFGWKSMCKVVEMELSLIYDTLYTKAAMVHSWGGYLIRFVSPLATVAAFLLFLLFYNKEGQRRADVIITYTLLAAAFILDMRWLVMAIGSTWTHTFLEARQRCSGCGMWRWLRRVVVSVDFGRLACRKAPSSYRMWSGRIGQYSLLHECTHDTMTVWEAAAKKIGLEEAWKEHHHSQRLELSEDVKRLVFERVHKILKSTFEYEAAADEDLNFMRTSYDDAYSINEITISWGQAAAIRRHEKLRRFRLGFGREFQEDILAWHIGTQVFLLLVSYKSLIQGNTHAEAIKALSDYMMFLVAARRHMLPGLALLSLYEVTFEALRGIWGASSSSELTSTLREEKLARTLRDKMDQDGECGLVYDSKTRLVLDGVNIAMVLLDAKESEMPELLELVFHVWVDKLLYAATRCSRESHAKQLGRGGELTTIVWILAEHVGPFQIGLCGPDHKPQEPPPPPMYPPPCLMPKYEPEEPWIETEPEPEQPTPLEPETPKKEKPAPPPLKPQPPKKEEPALPPPPEPELVKEEPAPPPPLPELLEEAPASPPPEPEVVPPPTPPPDEQPPKKEEPAPPPPPLGPVVVPPPSPMFFEPSIIAAFINSAKKRIKTDAFVPPPEPEVVPPPPPMFFEPPITEASVPPPEPEVVPPPPPPTPPMVKPLRRYATLYPVD